MEHLESSKPLMQYAFQEMALVATGQVPTNVAVQVLERSSTIEYFGDSKPQVRGGLFCHNKCAAFGVLLVVGRIVKSVYTCWLNYHNVYDRQVFLALEHQELLMVRFYGSNLQINRLYVLNNPLGDLVKRARARMDRLPLYSLDSYGKLLSDVSLLCGNGMSLWQRLEPQGIIIDLHALQDG